MEYYRPCLMESICDYYSTETQKLASWIIPDKRLTNMILTEFGVVVDSSDIDIYPSIHPFSIYICYCTECAWHFSFSMGGMTYKIVQKKCHLGVRKIHIRWWKLQIEFSFTTFFNKPFGNTCGKFVLPNMVLISTQNLCKE